MTPVNSTSLWASTSNQWLASSVSAHHAPPYRSSSSSEACRWRQHQQNLNHLQWHYWELEIHETESLGDTCMLSRPLWAVKPWWDWEEANSWSSSTLWDSKPKGGHAERGHRLSLTFILLKWKNKQVLLKKDSKETLLSYSWVLLAVTVASSSPPLLLPPTFSLVSQLSVTMKKTYVSMWYHIYLASPGARPHHYRHPKHFHMCFHSAPSFHLFPQCFLSAAWSKADGLRNITE